MSENVNVAATVNVDRDLEREVLISAPHDPSVVATVVLESVPVYFDLGWQKVDGEDYGLFNELKPASPDTSPAVEAGQNPYAQQVSSAPVSPAVKVALDPNKNPQP